MGKRSSGLMGSFVCGCKGGLSGLGKKGWMLNQASGNSFSERIIFVSISYSPKFIKI
jgi:hypothetical protein